MNKDYDVTVGTAVSTGTTGTATHPLVIDLGRKSKKAIRKLKNGETMFPEVRQAILDLQNKLPDADKNKQIIPLVVVYRKKRKKGSSRFSPFSPLAPLNFLR